MKKLPSDWLTNYLIDFEYKKYVLLAYLQSVKANFGDYKLFPDLPELQSHYRESGEFVQRKTLLSALFPREVLGINRDTLSLIYEELENDSEVMKEVDSILSFALPRFKETLEMGEERKEEVEQEIEVSPVGILPLEKREGYIFVYQHTNRDTDVYRYQFSVYDSFGSQYPRLNTTFLRSISKSFTETFTAIKLRMIREYKDLPNPATLLVEVRKSLPYKEAILPITQRKVSAYIHDDLQ